MQETDTNVNGKEAELQERIAAKREQLSGLYSHLGKKYYESHRHDMEQEFQADVENISAGENELARLENRLKKLREGLICPSCGSELDKDDRFCPSCGRKIFRNSSEDASTACPRCGSPVSAGQRFCVKCGYSLAEEPDEDIVKAAFEPQQNSVENFTDDFAGGKPDTSDNKEESAGSAASVCPNCGEPVEADMNFCIACGFRLRS